MTTKKDSQTGSMDCDKASCLLICLFTVFAQLGLEYGAQMEHSTEKRVDSLDLNICFQSFHPGHGICYEAPK